MSERKVAKLVAAGIIALFVLVVIGNSCTVVGPTEKGVVVTLGQVKGTVDSGMHFKVPFFSKLNAIPG